MQITCTLIVDNGVEEMEEMTMISPIRGKTEMTTASGTTDATAIAIEITTEIGIAAHVETTTKTENVIIVTIDGLVHAHAHAHRGETGGVIITTDIDQESAHRRTVEMRRGGGWIEGRVDVLEVTGDI